MNIKNTLNTRLPALFQDLDLESRKIKPLEDYIDLLLKVNKKISLTRVGDMGSWFTAHIEDSLRAYRVFNMIDCDLFIDAGSGNGLPGVVFAILSGKPFILCDVDLRKAEFLKHVCFKLRLNGRVYCGPIDDLTEEQSHLNRCFIYRGLGPEEILQNNFEKTRQNSSHIRFISSEQPSIFQNSKIQKYSLSDKSQRFLEIFQ